jgi:hypothetical protein
LKKPPKDRDLSENLSAAFEKLFPINAVAKKALGIDRVDTELGAQLLAELGDVAFHDVLFDFLVEDAVDGVEDLGLRNAATSVCD